MRGCCAGGRATCHARLTGQAGLSNHEAGRCVGLPAGTNPVFPPPTRARTVPYLDAAVGVGASRSLVPPAVGRVRSSGWTMLKKTWAARSSAWSACCFRSTWSNRKICGPTDLAVSPVISRKDLFGSTPPMDQTSISSPTENAAYARRLNGRSKPNTPKVSWYQTTMLYQRTQNFRYLVF